MTPDPDIIVTLDQLYAHYGDPIPTALIKELGSISGHYRQFIEASPFVILATSGPDGMDCSPRGDPAGFVRVVDEHTLLIPDRRGNNRVDSLRNIVSNPQVALLFLIPGIGEAMRVNGSACLSVNQELRQSLAMGDKVPRSVIVITVESIYPQCQKAVVRSKLWDASTQIPRTALPTVGEMMTAITQGEFDGKAYDEAYPERLRQTIY